MQDLYHQWGCDLAVGSGGDLALAGGSDAVNQRVCRRLLTNPGDYLWRSDYGGGLAQFVGMPASSSDIEAVVMSQLLLESAVPMAPVPQVTARIANSANANVAVNITYADPTTHRSIMLNVTTG